MEWLIGIGVALMLLVAVAATTAASQGAAAERPDRRRQPPPGSTGELLWGFETVSRPKYYAEVRRNHDKQSATFRIWRRGDLLSTTRVVLSDRPDLDKMHWQAAFESTVGASRVDHRDRGYL